MKHTVAMESHMQLLQGKMVKKIGGDFATENPEGPMRRAHQVGVEEGLGE